MSDVSVLVNPLVNKLVGDASTLLRRQFQLLGGLEEQVQTISGKLESILSILEDAEERQHRTRGLRDWLGKLQEVAYDIEDILETLQAEANLWERKQEVRHFKPPFSASQASYKLNAAEKIEKVLKRLDDIERERVNSNFRLETRTNSFKDSTFIETRITDYHVVESDVVGRDEDKDKLIETLLLPREPNAVISVLPIVGMAGLGKTTLAQLIYNDSGVKGHFFALIWVCVTQNFDFRRVLKDIIESQSGMPLDIKPLSNAHLKSRVLDFLRGYDFLLVLDDVWTESYEDWEMLSNVLKEGGEKSRVLVTTRSKRVAELMGTLPTHYLGILPDDKCQSLFARITFHQANLASSERQRLESIGVEIVKKCNGLPLAVKAMAGLVRGNYDINEWNSILKHDIWQTDTRTTKILPALRLSYDHLPSHLKRCFACCCVFPKAHVFNKKELVKFWKAASVIQVTHSNSRDSIDEIGDRYFKQLVSKSFFQPSAADDQENFKMHDLILDLAQFISTPTFCHIKDNEPCVLSERVRSISLLCKEADQAAQKFLEKSKKLRILVSPADYPVNIGQTLDKIFRTLQCLRILDLSMCTILEVPESIGELRLLRYLDLSKTEIRSLPNSTCYLCNLETLKLLGCIWLYELPKGLGNLSKLQHLELDDLFWLKVRILPPRMGSLTSLQDLHTFHVGKEDGYGLDELKNLSHLEGTLHISKLENATNASEANIRDKQRLDNLVFEWSDIETSLQDAVMDENILEDLQPPACISEIRVVHYGGNRFPSWVNGGILQNVKTLRLFHCKNCSVLSLGELPHLGKLHLKGLLELEEWSDGEYNHLNWLQISNCPRLKSLPKCFVNVRVVKIKRCDAFEGLPLIPNAQFLTLLDNISLKTFNEAIVCLVSINDQGERVQTEKPTFIDLLELKIVNCPKLETLPQIFAPQKLDIFGCPLLTTLPPPHFSKRFQQLAIGDCSDDTLVNTIPDTDSLFALFISNISNLSFFPKWARLPKLEALHISGCKDLVSLSEEGEPFQGLSALRFLSIRQCPKLEKLTENELPASITYLDVNSCSSLKSLGSTELLKKLTSLKDLYIEDCPQLQSLPDGGLPDSLQHLRIANCPMLISRCAEKSGPDWPKIMQIPDLEIEPKEQSSQHNQVLQPSGSRASWYRRFVCCKGM